MIKVGDRVRIKFVGKIPKCLANRRFTVKQVVTEGAKQWAIGEVLLLNKESGYSAVPQKVKISSKSLMKVDF